MTRPKGELLFLIPVMDAIVRGVMTHSRPESVTYFYDTMFSQIVRQCWTRRRKYQISILLNCLDEKFQDITGVTRIHNQMKHRRYRVAKRRKNKENKNNTQIITQKSKDRAKRTQLKTGGELKSNQLTEVKQNKRT